MSVSSLSLGDFHYMSCDIEQMKLVSFQVAFSTRTPVAVSETIKKIKSFRFRCLSREEQLRALTEITTNSTKASAPLIWMQTLYSSLGNTQNFISLFNFE